MKTKLEEMSEDEFDELEEQDEIDDSYSEDFLEDVREL